MSSGSLLTAANDKLMRGVGAIERRMPPWLGPVILAAVCGMGTVAVAMIDPHTPGRWPTCPSLTLFGVFCPGCGALRAMNALTRFDLVGVWNMNPLIFLGVPLVIFLWASWMRRSITGAPRRVMPAIWLWALFALIVVFAVLRNIPFFAPLLAPGAA